MAKKKVNGTEGAFFQELILVRKKIMELIEQTNKMRNRNKGKILTRSQSKKYGEKRLALEVRRVALAKMEMREGEYWVEESIRNNALRRQAAVAKIAS